MRNLVLGVLFLFAASKAAPAQCSVGNGLTLAHQGNRLGDPFLVTLSGSPGASGLLGVDVVPGAVSTPIGPV